MIFPKPKIFRSKKYLNWVRGHDCLVEDHRCYGDVVAHHVYSGGMGMKCGDDQSIPLCYHHHLGSIDAIHYLGRKGFEERYNINLEKAAKEMFNKWKEEVE